MEDNELRKHGLKVTAPRLKIMHIFESNQLRHLSAEDIYQLLQGQNENVSLATIYRVLTQFEAAGLLQRHNFDSGHAVFEMDGGDHHDHLVCVQCGLVKEFFDEVIELRQEVIAKQEGFEISDHSLTIYGLCSQCQKQLVL